MDGAISSTVPNRPSGMWATSESSISGTAFIGAVIGVSTVPGATALTRIPSLAHLTASSLVRAMVPALAALYPGTMVTALSADMEARLTTDRAAGCARRLKCATQRDRQAVGAVEVECHRGVEAVGSGFVEAAGEVRAGVVDQHVEGVDIGNRAASIEAGSVITSCA